MDPDANLKEQLRLVRRLSAQIDSDHEPDAGDVDRLCELVRSLDEWIAGGGFLPERWSR